MSLKLGLPMSRKPVSAVKMNFKHRSVLTVFFSRRQVVEEKPAWYFAPTDQSQMSLLILETLVSFTIVPTMSRQISSLRSP